MQVFLQPHIVVEAVVFGRLSNTYLFFIHNSLIARLMDASFSDKALIFPSPTRIGHLTRNQVGSRFLRRQVGLGTVVHSFFGPSSAATSTKSVVEFGIGLFTRGLVLAWYVGGSCQLRTSKVTLLRFIIGLCYM